MIKTGIIGYGKMGQIRHEAISASGLASVAGINDAQAKINKNGIRFFATPEELIADASIDAVFICTPNHLNKPLTVLALQSGKHVFCEKPPAFTAAEMEEVIQAEKASGKKLMYGFNHRHHDSVIKLNEMITFTVRMGGAERA